MEGTINQRIKQFCKEIGITVSAFEKQNNMANGYVNGISKGIGEEKLKTIRLNFPQLNLVWLLIGEGEMIISELSKADTSNTNAIENLSVTIRTMQETITRLMDENEQLRDELRKFYSSRLA